MMLALLLSLAPAMTQADDPPAVSIRLNHEQFSRGDRARVHVETAQDGYLLVLHADPDGRVRVLFPLDPTDDAFVRGGKQQELRGRSGRDAFLVDVADGAGTVLAAVARDPFTYDGFVRNDHWDYRALGGTSLRDDPLAGLFDIVRRMTGETQFEYDAATYIVGRQIASGYGYGYGYGHGAGYSRFRLGLTFGYPYRYGYAYGYGYDPFSPFCLDPLWGWTARCHGFGFGRSGRDRWPGVFGHGGTSVGGGRFVIPRDRVRYTPVEARVRERSVNTSARPRSDKPTVAPRERGRNAASGGKPSGSHGKPSVSRGSGSGSRPAAKPSGGQRSGGSSKRRP